jgi:hypothetical protein
LLLSANSFASREYSLVVRQYSLVADRNPVVAREYPLAAWEYSLVVREYPLVASLYSVTTKEFSLAAQEHPTDAREYTSGSRVYFPAGPEYSLTARECLPATTEGAFAAEGFNAPAVAYALVISALKSQGIANWNGAFLETGGRGFVDADIVGGVLFSVRAGRAEREVIAFAGADGASRGLV